MVILRGWERAMVEGEPCLWTVKRRERYGGEVSRPSWSLDRVISLPTPAHLHLSLQCSLSLPWPPCASCGLHPLCPSQAITEHLRETPDGPIAVCGPSWKCLDPGQEVKCWRESLVQGASTCLNQSRRKTGAGNWTPVCRRPAGDDLRMHPVFQKSHTSEGGPWP